MNTLSPTIPVLFGNSNARDNIAPQLDHLDIISATTNETNDSYSIKSEVLIPINRLFENKIQQNLPQLLADECLKPDKLALNTDSCLMIKPMGINCYQESVVNGSSVHDSTNGESLCELGSCSTDRTLEWVANQRFQNCKLIVLKIIWF